MTVYLYKLNIIFFIYLIFKAEAKVIRNVKYVTSSKFGEIFHKIIAKVKKWNFEKIQHLNSEGNYLNQFYHDEAGRFLSFQSFRDTDRVVTMIQKENLSDLKFHKGIFGVQVEKTWIERYFIHLMYWKIYWHVFLMSLVARENQVQGNSLNRFFLSDLLLVKHLEHCKSFQDSNPLIYGKIPIQVEPFVFFYKRSHILFCLCRLLL